jgi:hypothetical protein
MWPRRNLPPAQADAPKPCVRHTKPLLIQAKASKKYRVDLRLRDNTPKSRDLGIIIEPVSIYVPTKYLHIIIFPRRKLASNDRFNGAEVKQ